MVGQNELSLLLFADDIVMFAESAEALQAMLGILEEYCRKWRFEVNVGKSKVMVTHTHTYTYTHSVGLVSISTSTSISSMSILSQSYLNLISILSLFYLISICAVRVQTNATS